MRLGIRVTGFREGRNFGGGVRCRSWVSFEEEWAGVEAGGESDTGYAVFVSACLGSEGIAGNAGGILSIMGAEGSKMPPQGRLVHLGECHAKPDPCICAADVGRGFSGRLRHGESQ